MPLPEDATIDNTAGAVMRRWIHVHPNPKALSESFHYRV